MIRCVLAALLAGCASAPDVPSHADLRATAVWLRFGDSICSGTAVGPDLLVTAQHCGTLTHVRDTPVTAAVVEQGERDFVLYRITGITFEHYAKRGDLPNQGDRVRWWGAPMGQVDIYREGYVARVSDSEIAVSAPICRGDSGAGIFNDAGEVVGVVSAMVAPQHCQFALSLP